MQATFVVQTPPGWEPPKPLLGHQPLTKPSFDANAFTLAMDDVLGANVGSAQIPSPPGFASLAHPLPEEEGGEDYLWAVATPAPVKENPESAKMAESFSIFG